MSLDGSTELALGRLIQLGSKGALNRLVNANLWNVSLIVRQYFSYRIKSIEMLNILIHEGNKALIRAALAFKPGDKFEEFSRPIIRETIERFLYLQDDIDPVQHMVSILEINARIRKDSLRILGVESLLEC